MTTLSSGRINKGLNNIFKNSKKKKKKRICNTRHKIHPHHSQNNGLVVEGSTTTGQYMVTTQAEYSAVCVKKKLLTKDAFTAALTTAPHTHTLKPHVT